MIDEQLPPPAAAAVDGADDTTNSFKSALSRFKKNRRSLGGDRYRTIGSSSMKHDPQTAPSSITSTTTAAAAAATIPTTTMLSPVHSYDEPDDFYDLLDDPFDLHYRGISSWQLHSRESFKKSRNRQPSLAADLRQPRNSLLVRSSSTRNLLELQNSISKCPPTLRPDCPRCNILQLIMC